MSPPRHIAAISSLFLAAVVPIAGEAAEFDPQPWWAQGWETPAAPTRNSPVPDGRPPDASGWNRHGQPGDQSSRRPDQGDPRWQSPYEDRGFSGSGMTGQAGPLRDKRFPYSPSHGERFQQPSGYSDHPGYGGDSSYERQRPSRYAPGYAEETYGRRPERSAGDGRYGGYSPRVPPRAPSRSATDTDLPYDARFDYDSDVPPEQQEPPRPEYAPGRRSADGRFDASPSIGGGSRVYGRGYPDSGERPDGSRWNGRPADSWPSGGSMVDDNNTYAPFDDRSGDYGRPWQ